MAGVVVGTSGRRDTGAPVRWAADAARLRNTGLTLVHAWHEDVVVSLTLSGDAHPDLPAGTVSTAVPGRAADALLGAAPDLLVLGGHAGAGHVSHVTAECLRGARCPVVVVPTPGPATPLRGRVVVAVEGAEGSRPTLLWAAREADRRGATLVVVHAWQSHLVGRGLRHPAASVEAQGRVATERLQSWVEAGLGHVDVELHADHGGPLDEVLEHSWDADLLVVGRSPAHAGLARVIHGAVDHDLCGLLPCPVAVVPA